MLESDRLVKLTRGKDVYIGQIFSTKGNNDKFLGVIVSEEKLLSFASKVFPNDKITKSCTEEEVKKFYEAKNLLKEISLGSLSCATANLANC
ncbi:MAG: hypothetical protein WCX48_11930 [Bacteroidales bacterium]